MHKFIIYKIAFFSPFAFSAFASQELEKEKFISLTMHFYNRDFGPGGADFDSCQQTATEAFRQQEKIFPKDEFFTIKENKEDHFENDREVPQGYFSYNQMSIQSDIEITLNGQHIFKTEAFSFSHNLKQSFALIFTLTPEEWPNVSCYYLKLKAEEYKYPRPFAVRMTKTLADMTLPQKDIPLYVSREKLNEYHLFTDVAFKKGTRKNILCLAKECPASFKNCLPVASSHTILFS